jgi:hypothetical protein
MSQARDKIKSSAFRAIFTQLSDYKRPLNTFYGYRLLACDGSDLYLPNNPLDTSTYISQGERGYNLLHLNALYDLLNKEFVDFEIQGRR